jgi:hypothetical protein
MTLRVRTMTEDGGQDLAQKGPSVTCLCEREVVKGNLTRQAEERTLLFKSEQGGFLCDTITHLPHDEYGRRVGMQVCACYR